MQKGIQLFHAAERGPALATSRQSGKAETSLRTPNVQFVAMPASVTDDGTKKSVALPAANSAQYFRLRRHEDGVFDHG